MQENHEGTKRVRFKRAAWHDGTKYGPEMPAGPIAELPEERADHFIQRGDAVLLEEEGLNRIRFIRGVTYEGKDYGPGQPAGEVADLPPQWARHFIQRGQAVPEE